jgi:hypothetical protein
VSADEIAFGLRPEYSKIVIFDPVKRLPGKERTRKRAFARAKTEER